MCDVGMFSGAKNSWKKCVQRWRSETGSQILTGVEVVKLLKKVNDDFIKPESIKNAFRATGTYPFNVENVMFDRCYGLSSASRILSANDQDPADEVNDHQDPADEVNEHQDPADEVNEHQNLALEINDHLDPAPEIIGVLNAFQDQLREIIKPYMIMKHANFTELVSSMESQILCLKNIVSSPADPLSSLQVSSPANNSSLQVSSPETLSAPQDLSSSFSSILKSPQPFKRSEKRRNYKLKNFGVMTDKPLLEKVAADEEKKKQEENMKLTLRNMKKEKARNETCLRNKKTKKNKQWKSGNSKTLLKNL